MASRFVSLAASGLAEEYTEKEANSSPIVKLEEGDKSITVSCIFPGFSLSDKQEADTDGGPASFQEVGISGSGFVSVSGQPLLPVFRRFLQVPAGCKVRVKTRKGRAVTYDDVFVTPAQEEATDSDEDHAFEFDAKAYGRDAFLPDELVTVGPPIEMDGYTVVLLEICPLQYNPAKRKLRGYSNITVTLAFEESEDEEGDEAASGVSYVASTNREAYGNLVLNPRRAVSVAELRPVVGGGIIRPITYSDELLIIHHASFLAAAQQLAAWKELKGISTQLVDIAAVGNTCSQIKQYIRTRRRMFRSKLRYVLLMGDTNHIVTENTGAIATDYYYATLADPASDSDCVAPALAIGRIPIQTAAEAQRVVDQIIRYEKTPSHDPAYYDRMTAAAYFQDDSPQDGQADRAYMMTMEGIRAHLVSIGKEVQRIYVSNNPNPLRYKDGTSIPADVRSSIVSGSVATTMLTSETSEGQMMIGHRDHGDVGGWSHPSFTTTNLTAISGTEPSIFLSINCLTGRFDYSTATDSFAEAMLKLDGGAPSLVAATRTSGTWRNDSLIRALFDGLFPGVIPTFPGTTASYAIKNNRLGDLLNYAKMYLLVAHGVNSGVQDHYEMYHVVGDPTLEIWTAPPSTVRLSVSIIRASLVVRLSSTPADGVITVRHGSKILKTAKTSSRQLQIPLSDFKALGETTTMKRVITVSFSAPGWRYTEKRIAI